MEFSYICDGKSLYTLEKMVGKNGWFVFFYNYVIYYVMSKKDLFRMLKEELY